MSFFELLFYFLLLFSIPILASVARAFARGRKRRAWKTLRVYLVVVAIYAAVLTATTLATPPQFAASGNPEFLDDWSITVVSVRHVPHDADYEDYEVDFRLANRGKTTLSGPRDLNVYLLREDGTRYDAAPQASELPFDAPVKPGKSVITMRKFLLPTNLNRVELVFSRKGFRLGWFIIGRTPFDGHTVIQLQ